MQVFPADMIDCVPLISELIAHGLLSEYSVNGAEYLYIKGFAKHQRINRPSASKIPEPPHMADSEENAEEVVIDNSSHAQQSLTEESLNNPGAFTDGRDDQEGKGKEGIKQERETCEIFSAADMDEPVALTLIGKIPVTDQWRPNADFSRRAALWGCLLGDEPGYSEAELQQFRDFWSVEGKVKHQQQWEQSFASSLRRQRAQAPRKRQSETGFRPSDPDSSIPPGFRG
jgi:hypothetical protein